MAGKTRETLWGERLLPIHVLTASIWSKINANKWGEGGVQRCMKEKGRNEGLEELHRAGSGHLVGGGRGGGKEGWKE